MNIDVNRVILCDLNSTRASTYDQPSQTKATQPDCTGNLPSPGGG